MNKTELTKVVAEKTELTQKDAAAATQAVLDT
ncbi:HU family DNA-binding protein, partial [Bacillus thuringiensis]